MELELIYEEMLFTEKKYLVKVSLISIAVLLTLIIFYIFTGQELERIYFIAGTINLVCICIFISYLKGNLQRFRYSLLIFHVILLIFVYYGVLLREINLKWINDIFIFDANATTVINTILPNTLLIFLFSRDKNNEKIISNGGIKYFALIIIMLFLNCCNNISGVRSYYLYKALYIFDISMLLSSLYNTQKYQLMKKEKYNYFYITIIVLIALDILSFLLIGKSDNNPLINSIRFVVINGFIALFSFNIVKTINIIQFKDIHEVNKELENKYHKLKQRQQQLELTRQDLYNQDEVYREFLKVVQIPIVIVNKNNKRVNYSNKKFAEIVKKKELRDIVNKKIDSIIQVDNESQYIDDLENNKTYFQFNSDNDEVRIMEVVNINLAKQNDDIIMIFNDITEKRNIEKIKIELNKRKKDEWMKKNFLSNISHDLKTPIGVIYSAIQMENIYANNNEVTLIEKYNNVCKENCLYLTRLTNNLIDISRISEKSLTPQLVTSNIVYFIEDKLHSINELANLKNIEIVFDTEEEEVFVKYDKDFLERVIINILSNALKYTDEGGKVNINILDNDQTINIEVSDNGRGMSKEFISKAFNMYTSEGDKVNNIEKSSGIGLFVVYNLLKVQGASIELESEEGKGSKFIITFKKERIYEGAY